MLLITSNIRQRTLAPFFSLQFLRRVCGNCVLIIIYFTCFSGCVSHYRAQAIEDKLLALELKFEQMKKESQTVNARQETVLEHINQEFKNFNQDIFNSIDGIRKGSVSDSVDMDELKNLVQQQQGQLSELKFKLSQIQNFNDVSKDQSLPNDKNELYELGLQKMNTRAYRDAINIFTEFVSKYPDEIRADDSLFNIAEAYYQQTRYEESIKVIQQILKEYKDQNQADKALILLHDNYIATDNCKRARNSLRYLKTTYPRSNQIRTANNKLKKLKKCK